MAHFPHLYRRSHFPCGQHSCSSVPAPVFLSMTFVFWASAHLSSDCYFPDHSGAGCKCWLSVQKLESSSWKDCCAYGGIWGVYPGQDWGCCLCHLARRRLGLSQCGRQVLTFASHGWQTRRTLAEQDGKPWVDLVSRTGEESSRGY